MQETQVQSLGQEDSLEEEMTTHSSILAWKIPQTEEPGRLQSIGSHRVRIQKVLEIITKEGCHLPTDFSVIEQVLSQFTEHSLASCEQQVM